MRVNHIPVTNSISDIDGCAVYLQQIAQVSEIGMRGVTYIGWTHGEARLDTEL